MEPSAADVYLNGLEFVTPVIDRFPGDLWDRPSPCIGWRALDVLGHLGTTTRYGIELLQGGQPAWQPSPTPGELVDGDPKQWWKGLATKARHVMSSVDLAQTIDTPAGPRTIGDGLSFPAVDLYVHGWDIARSGGMDVEIPAEAIQFGHSVLDGIPDEHLRSPATFAPEVSVAEGVTPAVAFIAWTGRDPAWVATGP